MGFQTFFLFWIAWIILDSRYVELEVAHSFAIKPSKKHCEQCAFDKIWKNFVA